MTYNHPQPTKNAGFGRFLNQNAGSLIGLGLGLGVNAGGYFAPELGIDNKRYLLPFTGIGAPITGMLVDSGRAQARAEEAYQQLQKLNPGLSEDELIKLFETHFDDGDNWEAYLNAPMDNWEAFIKSPSKKKTKKKASVNQFYSQSQTRKINMSQPYSQYSPRTKQALSVGTANKMLNPTDSHLANYGIYGGAGALGGAGIGALMELLSNKKDKSYLKSMLVGGGIGGGLGLGAKALGEYGISDAREAWWGAGTSYLDNKRKLEELTTSDGILDYLGDAYNNMTGKTDSVREDMNRDAETIKGITESSALDALLAKLRLMGK